MFEIFFCLNQRKAILQVEKSQFVERLSLLFHERICGWNIGWFPVLSRTHQIDGGIECRIADRAVGEFYRRQQYIGHERARVIAIGFTQPTVKPVTALLGSRKLCSDARKMRAVVIFGIGKVSMLVAR